MNLRSFGMVFLCLVVFLAGCVEPAQTTDATPSAVSSTRSAGVTDCGTVGLSESSSGWTCFAKATENCGLAKILMSVDLGAGEHNTVFETKGLDGSLCLIHSDITAPEGSESNGLYFDCKIKPEALTSVLNEWTTGRYRTSIQKSSEECTGPIG